MDDELVPSVDQKFRSRSEKQPCFVYTDVKEGLFVNPATFYSHAKYGVQE